MLMDLLESYQALEKDGNLALDSYRLKEGLYIRLNENGEYHHLKVEKNVDLASEEYIWFRNRDFKSILVDMNKAVDMKKKIHSNNIYTVFFKSPKADEKKDFDISLPENIERYYSTLKAWGSKKEEEKILAFYHLDKIDLSQLKRWKQLFLSFLTAADEIMKKEELKPGVYVKLFADVEEKSYETEYLRYMIPKIFNCNDYNEKVEASIYGLSNSNMGLNSKKPYLEHKTTNFKAPYRVTSEQALNIYNLFLWLDNQYDENGRAITSGYLQNMDHEGYRLTKGIHKASDAHILHIEKGKYAVIDDYDFIPSYENKIDCHIHNYLGLEKFESDKITGLSELEAKVDELLFKGQLRINYFNTDTIKPKEWFTNDQIELLLWSKEAFYSYFRKGDISAIKKIFDPVSAKMVKLMAGNNIRQPAPALNLRLSMLKFLKVEGKENMGNIIKEIREKLTDDLVLKQSDILDCEDDVTYYYMVGQISSFLIGKSKAQRTTYRIAFDLLNARSISKFKLILEQLFKKYGYDIEINSKGRFNKLFTAVNSYIPSQNIEIHSDAFLAGLSSPCIIYTKAEELEGGEE